MVLNDLFVHDEYCLHGSGARHSALGTTAGVLRVQRVLLWSSYGWTRQGVPHLERL